MYGEFLEPGLWVMALCPQSRRVDRVLVENPRRFDMPRRSEKVFVSNGTRILIDKKSLLFMDGTEIDWEEQTFGHAFVYTNPNAKGICGCGTSFAV